MSVAEAEQMVAVPDTSTLYMARRSELRMVKKPVMQRRDAEGRPTDTIPGQSVQFRDGVLRVPHEGKMRLDDGREIDASEVNAWLDKHPLKGDLEEGFWRVDPTAPPPSEAELEKMQELAMDLDVDGLETFIEQERDGWCRSALLDVAERSLERVRKRLDESEAKRAEALQLARTEGEAAAREEGSE